MNALITFILLINLLPCGNILGEIKNLSQDNKEQPPYFKCPALENKRILHLCTHFGQGTGAHVYKINLFKILLAHGYDSRILLADDIKAQKELRGEGYSFYTCTLPSYQTSSDRGSKLYETLYALCKKDKIDLIHAHFPDEIFAAKEVAKSLPIAVVVTLHASRFFYHDIKNVDSVICVKQDLIDTINRVNITKECGLQSLHWIAPFFDEKKFLNFTPTYSKDEFFKKKFKIDIQPIPIIVTVANFVYCKNHTVLFKALSKLIHVNRKPVQLMLAGSGCYQDLYKRMISQLGLKKFVHFLGYTDQIPELLYHSDIKVLPSFREGFSIALMEAALMKKPLIGTYNTGMTSTIMNHKTGLLFRAGSPDNLANAIALLIDNKPYAKQLGNNCFEHIQNNFSTEACLKKLEQAYTEALHNRLNR